MGILYDKTRIKIKKMVNLSATEFEVGGADIYDRDPFVLWIALLENGQERNDFLLVGVHLKSRQMFIPQSYGSASQGAWRICDTTRRALI